MNTEVQLATWLQSAFKTVCGPDLDVSVVRVTPATDRRFGDFQCNAAMPLAKPLKQAPRALAEAVVKALPLPEMIEKLESAFGAQP